MKLKCTIGSLSCDGVLAEKGDLFELPDDTAKSIIKSGYAIEAQDEVPTDEGVQGVSRHDGTQIVKPQKNRRKK